MRLHFRSPPPAGWLPGWAPEAATRRCRCGARIVARSSAFARCARGCVRRPLAPPRPPPKPSRPPARERALYSELVVDLRLLERDFVLAQRKGRPIPADKLERAFTAMTLLWELCPGHGAEITAALPWLTRQAGGGRAA